MPSRARAPSARSWGSQEPNRPGLAKAGGPPLRRVAELAHDLATAALLGNADKTASLIRRLALEASPEHAKAAVSEAR